jgi:hypothetical protein
VDMHATDLVGINGITRVLLVSKVYTLEATYYPFDSLQRLNIRIISSSFGEGLLNDIRNLKLTWALEVGMPKV